MSTIPPKDESFAAPAGHIDSASDCVCSGRLISNASSEEGRLVITSRSSIVIGQPVPILAYLSLQKAIQKVLRLSSRSRVPALPFARKSRSLFLFVIGLALAFLIFGTDLRGIEHTKGRLRNPLCAHGGPNSWCVVCASDPVSMGVMRDTNSCLTFPCGCPRARNAWRVYGA